jgi:hypothetical protein
MLKKVNNYKEKEIFMHINTALLVMIGLTFTTFGHASCNAKIEKIEHVYDDFNSYQYQQYNDAKKRLKVSVFNDKGCQLYLTMTSENQTYLKGDYQDIGYQILSATQGRVSTSITRFSLTDSFFNIELVIPSGTPVKSGMYQDRLALKLFEEDGQLLDSRDFDINATISPKISLSMLGYSSSSNVIKLGELVPGQEYTMLPSLQVITNSDIKLSVRSENKGMLVHNVYRQKYNIGYSLNLDGSWLDLKEDKIKSFLYKGQSELFFPMSLHLSGFKNQAAGEYRDTIRFQISPLNY